MKQEEYFKIKSYINAVWNEKLFIEDYKSHINLRINLRLFFPSEYDRSKIRFIEEIGMDPYLTSKILPEHTMAGKTKLIIKIAIKI